MSLAVLVVAYVPPPTPLALPTRCASLRPGFMRDRRAVHCMDEGPWAETEDWALLDQLPAFSAGQGTQRATFWSALALSSPELARRSAAECEARAKALSPSADSGPAPPTLEDWERLSSAAHSALPTPCTFPRRTTDSAHRVRRRSGCPTAATYEATD